MKSKTGARQKGAPPKGARVFQPVSSNVSPNHGLENPCSLETNDSLILQFPPREWTLGCLADICERVQDSATPSANGERLYIGLEHLASGQPSLVGRGKESDVTSGKTAFKKRDVLFGKLRPYLRKSALAPEDGICSTDILVFRARETASPDYLSMLMHADEFIAHAQVTTSGVQHPRTSWAALREFKLHIPPLPEQQKIAAVLGLVQRAMEQQERLLAHTAELKKTLLHQLFTHGLRHEPQKQTEIGLIPQSWEVVALEKVAVAFDYGTSVKCDYDKKGVPVLRIPNISNGSIDLADMKYGQPKQTELNPLQLQDGDLLFVRTNGVQANAGRCALFRGELPNCYFASYLIRVRTDLKKLQPAFLNQYAETELGKSYLAGRAIRTADGKFNINSGTLRRVMLPLPKIDEQNEIVQHLALIEQKQQFHARKHAALSALFRTFLHEFMTAKIRLPSISA